MSQHLATTIFCHTFFTSTIFLKKQPTRSIDTISGCENSASVRGGGKISVTIGANCGGCGIVVVDSTISVTIGANCGGALCKEEKAKLGRVQCTRCAKKEVQAGPGRPCSNCTQVMLIVPSVHKVCKEEV